MTVSKWIEVEDIGKCYVEGVYSSGFKQTLDSPSEPETMELNSVQFNGIEKIQSLTEDKAKELEEMLMEHHHDMEN